MILSMQLKNWTRSPHIPALRFLHDVVHTSERLIFTTCSYIHRGTQCHTCTPMPQCVAVLPIMCDFGVSACGHYDVADGWTAFVRIRSIIKCKYPNTCIE